MIESVMEKYPLYRTINSVDYRQCHIREALEDLAARIQGKVFNQKTLEAAKKQQLRDAEYELFLERRGQMIPGRTAWGQIYWTEWNE